MPTLIGQRQRHGRDLVRCWHRSTLPLVLLLSRLLQLALHLVRAGSSVEGTRGGQPLSDLHGEVAAAVEALDRELHGGKGGGGGGEEDDEDDEDNDDSPRPYTAPG